MIGQSPQRSLDEFDEKQNNTSQELISPNPSYGSLQLNLDQLGQPKYLISINNIIGKTLWSKEITADLKRLDVSFLNKGTYLFCISKPNGEYLRVLRLAIVDI